MKLFCNILVSCALASSAGATVLSSLPSPMAQGGMIHLNIALNGSSLTADPEPGTPVIKPLSMWSPGNTLNPASPWYSTLDPEQAAGLFNSQFGLVLFNSDPLPVGSKIMVSVVSATPGLQTYQSRSNEPQLFNAILGTAGSPAEWDWSTMAHGMFHPTFVMSAGSVGTASATLAFTLTNSSGTALPGYTGTQATLNFNVIPEPSTAFLSALSGAFLLRRKRSTGRIA